MKLYVENFSSYRDDLDKIDLKKELKSVYKLDTRRQDRFIHLGVYGAQLLKQKCDIEVDDELYVTSGIGNAEIVQKTNTYMFEENQTLKLFDFINLLGNTTSYYIAKSLGMRGKNIFQISDNFTYLNSLVSIYASLKNSGKNAIICSIDLVNSPSEVIKRVLGVSKDTRVVSAVNYQKLSLKSDNALAQIEFDLKSFSRDQIKDRLEGAILIQRDEMQEPYFETIVSYKLNEAIKNRDQRVIIESFQNRYKILKLKILK